MSYQTRAGVRMNRPYNNQQSNANYNQSNQPSGYNNQNSYTQPAYSTPGGYGQNKQQAYQQPPQQQQKAPVQQQQPPPVPPAPAPAPPVVKETPAPPPPPPPQPEPKVESTDDKGGENAMDTTEEGPSAPKGPKFRPWNRRGPAGKISRKIRKRRQNARLRNLLAPKNAMMVLHELHPELKMVISEQVNAANQTNYTVEIEIEGKLYRGHGMSKMSAKQAASENALKAVLLEKLQKNNLKINPDNTLSSEGGEESSQDVMMKEEGIGAASGTEGEEGDKDKPAHQGKRPIEDDVPWGSLASFALFKLFAEWQTQGFQLPPSGVPQVFHKAAAPKKIPEDANKKHPVQLLNQIRPGSQYSESREGTPPHLTFKFTVVVDGQTFHGVGSNKRDAKKECAKRALEALGVKYDE